ncbi:hypothetical protein OMCYN_01577 [cyanobiont of Ornithocercus magnificus]|nr:hypothetical protein OMCYN_01577 [cyanobiont of Ornithocercus magnificus]
MASNAAELYRRIAEDGELTQALFRQALQDPQGALRAICDIGERSGLPVTSDEVRQYLQNLGNEDTSRWIVKARGGL